MIPIIENKLQEENTLQLILYPSVTSRQINSINNKNKISNTQTSLLSGLNQYDFQNGESFKGKIINGVLQKGKYMWNTGQIYQGSFNSLNQFNGRGLITFPDLSTLSGTFTDNELIKRAVYITKNKTMEGTFYKNNLHGKFIIHSNDFDKKKKMKNIDNNGDDEDNEEDTNNNNISHYKYVGEYYKGVKHGKFIMETDSNKYHYVITGCYNKGKKNGEFTIKETNFNHYSMKGMYINDKRDSVFKITDFDGKNIEKFYDYGLDMPLPYNGVKIEQKNCLVEKEEFEVNCMTVVENNENNIIVLLGIKNKISIYFFDKNNKNIVFIKQINVFSEGEVNDIIGTADKKLLLCSSEAKIKLIKLNIDNVKEISSTSTYSNNPNIINQDYETIQEFQGLNESKNIFILLELKNQWIVSGDCENIIIWEKIINKNKNKINNHVKATGTFYEVDCSKKQPSFLDSFLNIFGLNNDIPKPAPVQATTQNNHFNKFHSCPINYNNNDNQNEEKIKYIFRSNIKTSHTFSIIEIKNNLIVSAQPDSKSILLINIMKNDVLKELNLNKSICNNKNAMSVINDKLLIIGFEGVAVVNIDLFTIETFIYLKQKMNMICPYNKDTFLCFQKNKIRYYQNEWSMLQCVNHEKRKKIEIVSKLEKEKFKGCVNRIIVKKIRGGLYVFAVGKDEINDDDINKGKMIILY